MKKKKTLETIKKELLASILEVFEEEDYLQICEEVKNTVIEIEKALINDHLHVSKVS